MVRGSAGHFAKSELGERPGDAVITCLFTLGYELFVGARGLVQCFRSSNHIHGRTADTL